MNILEKEIEDLIWDAINGGEVELLRDRGLRFLRPDALFLRQVNLGSYGIADLIQIEFVNSIHFGYREVNITIIELKKGRVDFSTIGQAARYRTGVRRIIENLFDGSMDNARIDINIVAIGTSIDSNSDFAFFCGSTSLVSVYTVALSLDKGIRFNLADSYHLIDENFNAIDKSAISIIKTFFIKRINDKVTGQDRCFETLF